MSKKNYSRKIFIFISHSHLDINDVRLIRNYLESLGSEPLLFYLKSKTDENEITELIKDEINSRIWFIICDSKNAENSVWVKTEIEYANKIGKNNIIHLPLYEVVKNGKLTPEWKRKLAYEYKKMILLSNIYCSYNHHDQPIVQLIIDELNKYDISIKLDDKILSQQKITLESIHQQIQENDFFLCFIGNSGSTFQQTESEIAEYMKKRIIYVYLSDGGEQTNKITKRLSVYYQLMNALFFIFDINDIYRSSDKLIKFLFDLLD